MYIPTLITFLITAFLALAGPTPQVPPPSRNFRGDMTYFTPGLGSCGRTNNAQQMVVALSPGVMMNGPNPNNNPRCGRTVTITKNGRTAVGTVVDTCTSCAFGDINVTPPIFKRFAPLSTGRLRNVTWHFNAPA